MPNIALKSHVSVNNRLDEESPTKVIGRWLAPPQSSQRLVRAKTSRLASAFARHALLVLSP
jgi:hypothetical protein